MGNGTQLEVVNLDTYLGYTNHKTIDRQRPIEHYLENKQAIETCHGQGHVKSRLPLFLLLSSCALNSWRSRRGAVLTSCTPVCSICHGCVPEPGSLSTPLCCPPIFLLPSTVPSRTVFARPLDLVTWLSFLHRCEVFMGAYCHAGWSCGSAH